MAAGLVAIELCGAYFHRKVVPPHFTYRDTGMLLPVIICYAVSVCIGDRVGVWARLAFSCAQSLLLLHVFANYLRRPVAAGGINSVLCLSAACIAAYTVGIGASTHLLVVRFVTPFRRARAHQCTRCGYNLRGLSKRRCPECGTPFGGGDQELP